MKKLKLLIVIGIPFLFCSLSIAVESGNYRLLSVSVSEKMILVSQIPNKTKYLLDAGSAKITVNGKAGELKELKVFSILQLKADIKKTSKNGISLDGSASEIRILAPEKVK